MDVLWQIEGLRQKEVAVSSPWEVSFIKRGEGVVDRVGVLKNMTGDSEALRCGQGVVVGADDIQCQHT